MKAIEVSRNGTKLFTAGLRNGGVEVRLILRNQTDPVWFDAVGRDQSTGGHERWAHVPVDLGDEFTLKLVDVNEVDAGTTSVGEKR